MVKPAKRAAGEDGDSSAVNGNGRAKQTKIVEDINALPFRVFVREHVTLRGLAGSPEYTFTIRDAFKPAEKTAQDDANMTEAELRQCFDLIHTTSGHDYRNSRMGWKPSKKWREMCDHHLRYLLVHHAPTGGTPAPCPTPKFVGFVSIMITYEDGLPVLYIYEIHLDDSSRGRGIGRHLIDLVEAIAVSTDMTKIMLTVFRSNEAAIKWYFALGFAIDEYSPPEKKLRNGVIKRADYLILSKATSAVGSESKSPV